MEAAERALLKCPQVACTVTHRFAPGIYMREVLMPAGAVVIGHEHTTEHLNIMLTGRLLLVDSESAERRELTAPCSFVSGPGVRKLAFIREDVRWATIHATEETDIKKLENALVKKSAAYLDYSEPVLEMLGS